MKRLKLTFVASLLTVSFTVVNAQGTITPSTIEIGDMNQLPVPSDFDGAIKVVHSGQDNGVVVVKNPDANKMSSYQIFNDADIKFSMSVGGSSRANDIEKNCAQLVTVAEQYGTENLVYFVIGNRDSYAPIIFIQNDEEVARIDSAGNIQIDDPNSGLILTSPNGTKWKVTVDNNGNLTTSNAAALAIVNKSNEMSLVYPNPTDDDIIIELMNDQNNEVSVEIYDVTGKLVYMNKVNSKSLKVDIKAYMNGSYVLMVKDYEGKVLVSRKIIKE